MDIEQLRKKYFPLILPSGYSVRSATREEVFALFKSIGGEVFGPTTTSGFRVPDSRTERAQAMTKIYQNLHHEYFLFQTPDHKPVGWFMGEAEDALTFYFRHLGILPEHQNKKMYSSFVLHFEKYLAEIGYERTSIQHKVTNRKIIILQLKLEYLIASLELTENWGPLVKLVKLLQPDRRSHFVRMYGDELHQDFFK